MGKDFTNQIELFKHIWETHPHVSEISDLPLDKYYGCQLWFSCFAHILSKKMYPTFKLREDNIMLLDPREHTLYDQGTKAQMEIHEGDWQKLFNKRDELKQQYLKEVKILSR